MKNFIIFLLVLVGVFFGFNAVGSIIDFCFFIIMIGLILFGVLCIIDGIKQKGKRIATIVPGLVAIGIGVFILLIFLF